MITRVRRTDSVTDAQRSGFGFTRGVIFVFQIGHGNGLPEELIEDYEENEEFLKKIHHVLMEVSI